MEKALVACVVFVTTRLPYPAREGHQLRTYNLLKRVALHHEVHLLSFARKDDDTVGLSHLQTLCKDVETFPIPMEQAKWKQWLALLMSPFRKTPFVVQKYNCKKMRKRLKDILTEKQVDILHLDMLPLAVYIDIGQDNFVLLNEHNIESWLLGRRAAATLNPLAIVFFKIQEKKLMKFEEQACTSASHVVVCSELDKNQLQKFAGSATVTVVPNGVNAESLRLPATRKINPFEIAFVGSGQWFPNSDGIHYFLKRIMPLLLKKEPDITLKIIGNRMGYKIPDRLTQSVRTMGFADDLAIELSPVAVYIVPLKVGSGTRLKLLEAMAMGIPVVSTSVGCEGIIVTDHEHLLVADTPDEFVNAIITLMHDNQLAVTLAEKAQELISLEYDWNVISKSLLNVYASAL